MRRGFTINSIVFLIISLLTISAWVIFETYHQSNNVQIPFELSRHADTPLPTSFDANVLNKLYSSKDQFYELPESTEQPAQQ